MAIDFEDPKIKRIMEVLREALEKGCLLSQSEIARIFHIDKQTALDIFVETVMEDSAGPHKEVVAPKREAPSTFRDRPGFPIPEQGSNPVFVSSIPDAGFRLTRTWMRPFHGPIGAYTLGECMSLSLKAALDVGSKCVLFFNFVRCVWPFTLIAWQKSRGKATTGTLHF